MNLREFSTKEVAAILKANGYELQRTNGGHSVYSNGNRSVSVPVHKKMVNKMLFRRIIKEYELNCNL